ncbi:MAG TPA: FAD-dependent oxidoreductase [Patescibacteria group bacterium]|nr:FAD-dependent oxidoreductase [Patescibacteria group bacterium]
MSLAPDVIIVGAGIVGAACAAECAEGGLKVLILDRGPIGGGTTGAGMGHLVVMDDSEAQFALTSYSVSLWKKLAQELPANVELDPCGTLWLAADDEEMAEVYRKQTYYTNRGVKTEVLDEEAVHRAEPNLRKGMAGGLVVPNDAVLYPPTAARYLFERAIAAGAELKTSSAVSEFLQEGGVLLGDGSRIPCGRAVNAAGPWSPNFFPGLPVRKRKGHLVITERYPGFVRHQIVELGYLKSAHGASKDSVAFNIQPRKNGQMLVGSSRQYDVDTASVDQPILDRMLKRALEYLPTLGQLSTIRVWTGHRAATPDKLPIIGPSSQNDRIWFATGHEGLGITTSLGTGRLLADLLLNRPTAIPAKPYAASRFENC